MRTNLYLATAEGLYVIAGSDEIWQGDLCLKRVQLQCVAVSAHGIHCGSFGSGVLSSRDGNTTWTRSRSLATARITAITAMPDGTLYAGGEPSAVYRSQDGGDTWNELKPLESLPSSPSWSFPPRPETHHVQAILADPNMPCRLHVAVEAGALVKSSDCGRTWEDRVADGPSDTHTLAFSPLNPHHVFSAAGDGFFESTDAGESWSPFNEGLQQTYCWSVAVASGPTRSMLLSASDHAFAAHNPNAAQSFVYRRLNEGHWQLAMQGLASLPQSRIAVIVAAPLEPETFFLATDGFVYKSSDQGLHWKQIPVQWKDSESVRRHSLCMAISQEEE